MPLDLSDEALGLPTAPAAKKGNGLDLSDEALGLPPVETKQPRSGLGILPGPLGILQQKLAPEVQEEMRAAWEGLWSMGSAAYGGLKGVFKGGVAATAGLPFGEVFREEFDSTVENAAEIYKPLSPEGPTLTHKLGDMLTRAVQSSGDFVMEKGLPLPGPLGILQQRGMVKGPGAGSPAAAAGTQALVTLAMLAAPLGRRQAKAGVPHLPTWEEFAGKYPEAAKAIDASSLGAVRWQEVRGASIADIVGKQMDAELGLKGEAAKLPFETKAAMVFDKVAPNVPLGEKLQAVRALKRKITELDAARVSFSQQRGLPAPSALEGPITVTKDGVALTAEQARALEQEWRTKTPSQRADELGISVVGQLKKQANNVLKHEPGSPEYNMEMSAMERMWKQAFPDEYLGKRSEALDAFINFRGDMSYPQILEKLGPARSEVKARARAWRKMEEGAIDIEGMEYLLNSFRDLPNQPVLKRATIVGQLNRQGVPEAEKQAVLRALRDKDTITQKELVGNVAMDILPLKPEKIELQPWDILDDAPAEFKIGIRPGTATIRVWEGPVKHGIETNHPEIYGDSGIAHTRFFDRAGTRSIAEIQSDLMQGGLSAPQPPRAIMDAMGTVAMGLERGDFTVRDVATQGGFFQTVREQLYLSETRTLDYKPDALVVMIDRKIKALEKEVPTDTAIRQRIQPLEKRWYERIIMEENRLAAQEGVMRMRVPTPETVAKVEFFPTNRVQGEHKLSTPIVDPESGKTIVRALVTDYGSVLPLLEDGSTLVSGGRPRLVAEIDKQIPRQVAPAHQTILDFYKRDVAAFARARYDAKVVADEFNNTWLEWSVKPEDATKKIPAFGGRQRGAIDIPDWEAVQKMRQAGATAAQRTAERGWGVPTPADDQLYQKTQKAFEDSRAAEVEGHKITLAGALKRLRQETVAHDYDLRVELERAGPYGDKAVQRLALQNGATMAAKSRMDAINENVFSNLTSAEKRSVDELMRLRRIIEIDSYKGVGKHKHPEGITGPEAEAVALRMKRELGDEQFAKIYDATNRVMAEYKGILNRRLENGLLSEDSYLKLIHFDYSPTEFIDLIDPMQTYTVKGQKISVRTSGVPYLERGKKGRVVMDSQLLLAEALVRSENAIFKNDTLKALHELAKQAPDNQVVSLPKASLIGKAGTDKAYMKTTPKGQVALGVRFEGRQEFVLMRDDLAEQFVRRPQIMSEFVNTMARIASGSAVVKATATTYNPTFIVAGLPMDVLHTWLASSTYSRHFPKFVGQMGGDLIATAKDAWTKGPEYQQALREGLGSAFMTHEGRGFTGITEKTVSIAERQMMPRFDRLKSALSYMNEAADIWVRMAHRHRLISQGLPSEQATGIARNRLDYSAGGEFTRAVDTVIPYTNVAVQALAKVAKQANRDPADFATKLAWAGGTIAAWQMANMISSPETWQQIPTDVKLRYLPITFGDQWYILDADGNKRYVYMPGVRLDAVVEPLSATLVAGLESAEFGRPPDRIITEALQNTNPVFEFAAPPTIEAIKTYMSNYDAFTGRPISPQFGQVKPEDEGTTFGRGQPPALLSQHISGATGLSAPRLDAAARKVMNTNNLYLALAGWGYKQVFGEVDPRTMSQSTEEMLLRNPAVRPFVRLTNPSTRYLRDIEERRMEEGSRRKQMTDSIDDLLFQVRKGQANIEQVRTYINNQPAEEREWLSQYAVVGHRVKEIMNRYGASEGIPNESWWRAVATLPPRARAQEFYAQWLSADAADRRRMQGIAQTLHNAGAGFWSENFQRELAKERQLLGTEQR
jgi:hypothetical protein